MGEENQNTSVSLRDKIKQSLDFQINSRKEKAKEFSLRRAKQMQDIYTSWLNSTNHWVSQQCTKAYKVEQIAEWIRDYFSKPENWWEDYSNIEAVPLVDNYISLNPDRKAQLYDYVLEDSQICDPTQLYTDMGWIEPDWPNGQTQESKWIRRWNPVTKAWTLTATAELIWMWLEKWGKSLQKSALWKTAKDIEKDIKSRRFEETYKLYDNKINKINKDIDNIINVGWDESKLSELQAERERLTELRDSFSMNEKPTMTADVWLEMDLKWWNKDIAAQAWADKKFLWTEEVQPYLDKSEAKFKYTDFLDSLKYEDFPEVNEYNWKDYQKIIDDMKETYKNKPDMSLSELHEEKKLLGLSNKAIKWEESKTTLRNIQDKLYTKMNDAIKTTLENENNWMWIWKKYEKYWLLTEIEENAEKAAKAANAAGSRAAKMPATKQQAVLQAADQARRSKNFKTRAGSFISKVWKIIRPSTRLEKALNGAWASTEQVAKIINSVKKWENITSKVWKWWWKVLSTLTPILDAIALWDEVYQTKERYENSEMPFLIQNKMLWKAWLDKWTKYEWWTEKDWEEAWLWQDVIRDYLDSDDFQERLDLTTYKRTWGRKRAEDSYRTMYY